MLMHQQHFKTIMATKILRIAKIKIELCDFVKTCNKSTFILRIHEYPRKPYQGQTLVFFPALTAMAPSVLDKSKTFSPKQLHKFQLHQSVTHEPKQPTPFSSPSNILKCHSV